MATELAQAYVQIIPSAKGIKGSLSKSLGGEASSAGASAGESIGSSLVGKLKGIIVAAGIGEVVKNAISAGADVEQSFGGLETIYGDASKAAKDYAAEAYKAGISMNDYAEQAVSFGAGLKQAFDGDTAKAVEAANTAIMDMTDNAAKMGTPIESIQNAYQGFAKSNYTMLDNLKLGYGGTKTEMERLLKDAEKISGVKYDIGNLGDVYDAIHVIQGELGLTGVAAEEASTTLSGSLGAMKASFTNLLATITTGGDVWTAFNNLTATLFAFVQNNLIPMIGNIFKALPEIIVGILRSGRALINNVFADNSDLVATGMDLIISLGEGIIEQIPYLLETLWNIATQLGEQIINYDWSGTFNEVVEDIADIINVASSEILGVEGSDMLGYLAQSIMDAIPTILTTATEIINGLVNGILNAIPVLLEVGTQVLSSILDGIMTQFPNIMQAAADIVMNLFNGIINNLPQIVVGAVKLITTLLTTFVKHYPEILKKGIEIIGQLVAGLIRAIPKIIPAVIQIISGIKDTIKQVDWLQLGIDIVKGIVEGLKSAGGLIKDAVTAMAKEAWGGMKDFFKKEIGSSDEESSSSSGSQSSSSSKNSSSPSSSVQSTISANTVNTNSSSANDNIVTTQKMYDLMSEYLPQMTQSHTQVNVSLEGDAKGLFNAVRTENTKLIRATGYHALA